MLHITLLCLLAVLPTASGETTQPARRILRSFEGSAEGYVLGDGSSPGVTQKDAFHGNSSLELEADFPGRVEVLKRSGIGRIGEIEICTKVVPDAPGDLHAIMLMKDKDGLWWQSEAVQVGPGAGQHWRMLSFSLYEDFHPVNHRAPFDKRFAAQIETVGFRFSSRSNWQGRILLDCLRGRDVNEEALAISGLPATTEGTVPLYRPFEVGFRVDGPYFNPFDPDEIAVDAVIDCPSGKQVVFPCYFCQDFERRRDAPGDDLYIPTGPGHWRLRFAPFEEGSHIVIIRAKAEDEKAESGRLSFTAAGRDKGMPPVRVSKANTFCFETIEGKPFYPVGHNVRSPTDTRCTQVLGWSPLPDRGLTAYERYFPRMAENGENLAEVWMASWWLGLEWTGKWKGYHGVGRYNLQHAWMLDALLELAYRHGLYIHLVVDNHGKISSYCDQEWQYSPYNQHNGGFLFLPDHFFTDERARKLHKQKLRYIIARWCAFTNIMGFELISELDLTGSRHGTYKNPYVLEWHREMTAFFRSLDCYGHPLTTHFSGNFNVIDPKIAEDPCIDYVVVDAYRGGASPFPELMFRSSEYIARFKKPFMITEYGGAWNGTDEAGLHADLHSGLWSAACTRSAGTPLLWWFDFIERKDLYWEYKAFQHFMADEDNRRTVDWKESAAVIGKSLACVLFHGKSEGRGWIFDIRDMTYLFPANMGEHTGVKVAIPVENGDTISVEYWDTREGLVLKSETISRGESGFQAVLPDFRGDIALKWKATHAGESETNQAPVTGGPASLPPSHLQQTRRSGNQE